MVEGALENQEDILPGKLSRQGVEEGLEVRRIRSWHDQIDTSLLRRDRAVQIDVFANELGSAVGGSQDQLLKLGIDVVQYTVSIYLSTAT